VKEPTDHKGTEAAVGKDDAAKKEEAARKEADAGAAIDAQLRKAREVRLKYNFYSTFRDCILSPSGVKRRASDSSRVSFNGSL
jgi:hypothetical protein